jgi:hypothetical protein
MVDARQDADLFRALFDRSTEHCTFANLVENDTHNGSGISFAHELQGFLASQTSAGAGGAMMRARLALRTAVAVAV